MRTFNQRRNMAGILRFIFLCCFFAAAGCARIEMPVTGPHHPANPKAQSNAVAGHSNTLDIDEDNLPAPPPQMPSEMKTHSEGSHRSGSSVHRKGATGK
jgi:hypothetical protein